MRPKEQIQKILRRFYSDRTVYIIYTGYACRFAYEINENENFKYKIFYMQGSMGLAPCIGLGLYLSNSKVKVVVINGDGSYLMQAGFGTVIDKWIGDYIHAGIIEHDNKRWKHLILQNHIYESTGGQEFDHWNYTGYQGITEIIDVEKTDYIPDRVDVLPFDNTLDIKQFIQLLESK